ncbi:MAG: filamentous hemagglutinin N-terminal domain-containing protein, partial [Candidatus Competibacteraceae bacterium]|nr:filamentous hemagglutinin N-terminal domain-containing protein [Candidatus Competibacteraceae bacterium]
MVTLRPVDRFFLFFGLMLLAHSALTQVTLDGTLGPAGPLSGPNYAIPAEVGQQHGGNLFHSFGQFSIHAEESATFSGPNSVSNIIGRVTGGQVSTIDGLLRSTIPGANLYLLNPAGLLFGPNATLDVSGSFHASTADYLRLGEGGRFEALTPGNSVLTVAPVEAFGFLGDAPGQLTIQDSFLRFREGQTLSLIGGDLTLHNTTLYAPAGRIDLAAVSSAGDVLPTATGLEVNGVTQRGDLHITRDPTAALPEIDGRPVEDVDASGRGGGAIVIRAGNMQAEGVMLSTDTRGDQPGGGIDIALTGDLTITRSGQIHSNAFGSGNAGNVTISAD